MAREPSLKLGTTPAPGQAPKNNRSVKEHPLAEASYPAVSQREALSRFASGIVIITAITASGPTGFTCQSFTSLSLEPPLLSFNPSRASTSWPLIRATGHFCINILAHDQRHLSDTFARTGTNKFANIPWTPAPSGAPVLTGVLAWADCSLWAEYNGGDHTIAAVRIHSLEIGNDQPPLLFYRGGYGI